MLPSPAVRTVPRGYPGVLPASLQIVPLSSFSKAMQFEDVTSGFPGP